MYTITKQFSFSASHQLQGLPDGHPCARLHGHNYIVEVVLSSTALDSRGFVVDYGDLSPLARYLDEAFDHRHLNDALDTNPTAENLACHLFGWAVGRWPQLLEVRVSETPKTWASYRASSPPMPWSETSKREEP